MMKKEYNVRIIGGSMNSRINREESESCYFSAFKGNEGEIIISDPFLHRIIFVYPDTGEVTYSYLEGNSFPRWVIPFKERYFFVDRNLNDIGFIDKNGNTIKKHINNMENLISASVGYDGKILICGRGRTPLMKIDDELNVLEVFFNASCNFQSAQEIEKGKFLIVDIEKNVVYICDDTGTVYWNHGLEYHPGNKENELLAPKYACIKDDNVYIADTKNNRIKIVNLITNNVRCIYGDEMSKLWYPTCIDILDTNNIFITDCLNQRIVKLNSKGEIIWQFGNSIFNPTHIFKSPRMIEVVDDEIFVINAYGNDLVKISGKDWQEQVLSESYNLNLFWPKGIKSYQQDFFLICDSRRGRILNVDSTMKTYCCLEKLIDNNVNVLLKDPHDIDVNSDGKFMITDAGTNMVYLIENTGTIIWEYGINGELKDPHQGRFMSDGNYMITDSGHDRIIFVDCQGTIVKEISELVGGRLKKPRWCEKISEELFLIADTGNNRVIVIDRDNVVILEHGGEWGAGLYNMRQPRCAKLYNGKILISDTDNNRVVILEGLEDMHYTSKCYVSSQCL